LDPKWKAFGIPIVASLRNIVNGSDLRNLYLKWFHPLQDSVEEALENCVVSERTEEVAEIEGVAVPGSDPNVNGLDTSSDGEMEFYITDDKGTVKNFKILMNELLAINGELSRLHVLVCWSEKEIKKYDTQLCSSLPEVCKFSFSAKRPQESVSLYKCLEAFLQEEPLGPEDMWLVTVFMI
jgi:ubiquitin carboxyl-terminal hydrolase 4/11/15